MSIPLPSRPGWPTAARLRSVASPSRSLAALGTLLLIAAAWRIVQAAGHRLWLDELYTTTLIEAPSLGHVWAGALRGVDGNPPLYLSLSWLLTRAVPDAAEPVLRGLNLALLSVAAVLLYRIGRRLADPSSVVAGLLALCATDGMVAYALLELRTYALYLTLVTVTLWATLRVMDRPSPGRTGLLAVIGVLATLTHSFGGFYVLATSGAAAIVALFGRDRRRIKALALAALPAAATLAGWIHLSLAAQLAVASPYGWIPAPDMVDLLVALTGSLLLTLLLALGLIHAAVRHRPGVARLIGYCTAHRDAAVIGATCSGFAGLTGVGWLGSQVITPFFVPRYFIPNVVPAALLLVAALAAARRHVDGRLFAVVATACIVLGIGKIAVDPGEIGGAIPCRDAGGGFLEEGLADEGLPIVAESPHVWLPRARYAPRQRTLYPLDWQVVLRYPSRARNNAMDFHIMEILRDWAPPGSALAAQVLPTEDILARHRRFLVLDEDARSWFARLRTIVPVSANLLREGAGCRLWDVRLTGPGDGPS